MPNRFTPETEPSCPLTRWLGGPERLSTFQNRQTSLYPARIRTPHRPARCLVTLPTTLSRLLWIKCNAFFILKKYKLSLPVVSETLRNTLDSRSTSLSVHWSVRLYPYKPSMNLQVMFLFGSFIRNYLSI